jgi:1-acyl-sn-glycerol-3-phosphate acyltransferase
MATAPNAKVIPLQRYAVETAATRRAQQRAEGMRQHPSAQPRRQGAASGYDLDAVVRPIHAHWSAASSAGETAAVPNALATRVAAVAEFLRRRVTGDYAVDEFGFDPHFNDAVVMPLLRTLFKGWFRVEVSGIEHLPEAGAALVLANHAGVLPVDGLMASVAVHDLHPTHRPLRPLAADIVFDSPVLGSMARMAGHTMAGHAEAHRLLSKGELTAVFPEGYKGLGKCFKDRYKLQRFGRGGFFSAASRAKAPIIPCSIVGSEEIYPMVGDLRLLARLLQLPYFPVTPLFPLAGPLGLIPLPSKWYIEFGAPIQTAKFGDAASEDPMVTFELTNQVRETIQRTLYRLLTKRCNTFLGCEHQRTRH